MSRALTELVPRSRPSNTPRALLTGTIRGPEHPHPDPLQNAQAGRLPALRLLYVLELTPDEEAVHVVGLGAALQRHDVLPVYRGEHGHVLGTGDELPEDLVGVLPALGVRYVDLVALLELAEVVEGQVALGTREAEAVAGDVDVGLFLPREARGLEVDAGVVVKERLIGADPGGYLVVLYPLHLGNRELHHVVRGGLDGSDPSTRLLRTLLGRNLLFGGLLRLRVLLLCPVALIARGRRGGAAGGQHEDRW